MSRVRDAGLNNFKEFTMWNLRHWDKSDRTSATRRQGSAGRRHRLRGRGLPRNPRLELLEDRIVLWNTYVSLGDADGVWSFTNLSYSYSNLMDGWLTDDGMTTSDITDAVEESMGAWTGVTPLTFFQLGDSGPAVSDNLYDPIGRPFMRWGHHYIDGSTGLNTLAHGYRPGDDGRNGDMHFDDSNTWTFNTFMETAIHEFGHAIGMAHANGDVSGGTCPTAVPAIMDACAGSYSFNGRDSAFLLQDDVDGIRSLYGSGLGYVINSSGALNIYGTGASDTIVLNSFYLPFLGWQLTATSNSGSFTRSAAGVSSIKIHGLGGDDYLRVEGNAGLPVTILGGAGNDFIDFSFNSRNLGNITGSTFVQGGGGTDSIFVYDDSNAAASVYDISSVSVNRAGFGGFTYGVDVEGVTLRTGTGSDTVNIPSTYPGQPVFVNSNGGADTVNIGSSGAGLSNIRSDIQIQNDPNFSTVNINDTGSSVARNATIEKNGAFGYVTGLASANIFWDTADINAINLTTGSGFDTITVARNTETLNLYSSGGQDTVNLGRFGNMQEITGTVTIRNSPSYTKINADDSNDSVARTVSVSTFTGSDGSQYGAITGLAPAAIQYKSADTLDVTLRTGAAADSVSVAAISKATSIIGNGPDTVYVGIPGSTMANILAVLSISNPNNYTTLVLNDAEDTSASTITVTRSSVSGLSPYPINYVTNDLAKLYVYAGSGGNIVNVESTPSNSFGASTFLSSGTGSDVVNVKTTSGAIQVSGGGGSDIVNVGNAGRLDGILAPVDVVNYVGGTVLGIHNDADTVGRTATLNFGQLTWLNYAAPVTWTAPTTSTGGVTYLGIDLGSGSDTLTAIQTDAFYSYTYVQTGAGNDAINVQRTSGGIYIFNSAGTDTTTVGGPGLPLSNIAGIVYPYSATTAKMNLILDDSASVVGRSIALNSDSVTGLAANTIYYDPTTTGLLSIKAGSGSDALTLYGIRPGGSYAFDGGGGSDTLYAENGTNNWNLASANIGNLASSFPTASPPYNYTVAFLNVENLRGGTGVDNFAFKTTSASLGGVMDGGGGTNRLDYSQGGAAPITVRPDTGAASRTGGALNIQTYVLGGGSDTVIGPNAPNTWNINGDNVVKLGVYTIQSVENLTGGNTTDLFKFAAGKVVSGVINGGGGMDTLDYSQYSTSVVANLASGLATGIGGELNVENLIGGKGNDTLSGDAQANQIDGGGGVDSINGGDGSDTFTVMSTQQAGTTINGGGGVDTLVAANGANTWQVNGGNSGLLNGIAFLAIENLNGGTGVDTLQVQPGGNLSGAFNGGAGLDVLSYALYGNNASVNYFSLVATGVAHFASVEKFVGGGNASATTLIGSNAATTWTINAAGGGNVAGFTFAGMRNLTGGSGADLFSFAGGSIAGQINGGGGVDTLAAANGANTWQVNGGNSGSLNGISFLAIENLNGGMGVDTLQIQPGGNLSGTFSGGGGLDVLSHALYTNNASVNLLTLAATGVAHFASVEKFVGGGNASATTLIGSNAATTWTINAAGGGTVAGFTFAGMRNLTGGSGADLFSFAGGGSIAGQINGGGEVDTLDFSLLNTSVNVNLATGAATATGGVVNFENVLGGNAADTLIGNGLNNILSGGNGNDTIDGGAGRDLLIGGLGADTIKGGGGEDLLISQSLTYAANLAKLREVMAEWTRTDVGYTTRIDHLKNGGGLNGVTRLALGYLVDDAIADLMISGGSELDWFLAKLPPDVISDLAVGEVVN